MQKNKNNKELTNYINILPSDDKEDIIKKAAFVQPTKRQLKWQKMEFYSFIHFGLNTFTDNEWGSGNEDPSLFNPKQLDTLQWVQACKEAGMEGLILTCKHHDGFCLWPSQYTDYSVKNSPWKNGKGDLVAEVSEACRGLDLKFGIYLSPWDRHEKTYGYSEEYNRFFKNQLRELLSNYGKIFSVWFDGACGEGDNGKVQKYDWEGYYEIIRELQPEAVISVSGPDVRWCGNEAGHCRKSEWSVVPASLQDNEKIAAKSQQEDSTEFRQKINSSDQNLGGRDKILNAEKLHWYPAEVNTSIRPGWFYHSSEDDKVKSLAELVSIYDCSVGGNASFLLNLPPDQRGLIHENDLSRLKELGTVLKNRFNNNLAEKAAVSASEIMNQKYNPKNILQDNDKVWCPNEETTKAELVIDLKRKKHFNSFILKEDIKSGQRIEEFTLEYNEDGEWKPLYQGTIIGYKKIETFAEVNARYLKLNLKKSRWQPRILFIGIYKNQMAID